MKKSKLLIGVSFPNKKNYLIYYCFKLAVFFAGAKLKIITPDLFNKINLNNFAGFIISGGTDINPKLYGQKNNTKNVNYIFDDERDNMEQKIINFALKKDKGLLGICRGMQIINVTLGGNLFQEVSEVFDDFLPNNSIISKIIGRRLVKIEKNSFLREILLGKETYQVNSIHHQAVNKLGKNLIICAKEENGLIQAFEKNNKFGGSFLLGLQWHPELMIYQKQARDIFRKFIQNLK